MTDKLKPCPFCGSENVAVMQDDYNNYRVTCRGCGAMGAPGDEFGDNNEIEKWNQRANIVDYSNAFKAWRKFIHVALWRMDGNEYELVFERDHEYNSDTNLAARVAGEAAAFGYGYAKLGELAVYVTAIPNGVEFRSKTHKMTIEVKIEVK
jgi:Lar family restriction alleviation protein